LLSVLIFFSQSHKKNHKPKFHNKNRYQSSSGNQKQRAKRCLKASYTLEATLLMPAFLCLLLFSDKMINFHMTQLSVAKAVTDAEAIFSPVGYTQRRFEGNKVGDSLLSAFWPVVETKLIPIRMLKDVKNMRVSAHADTTDAITVSVTYDYVFDLPIVAKMRYEVEQGFCFYPYYGTGYVEKKSETKKDTTDKKQSDQQTVVSADTEVYIAESGVCYHVNRLCGYIYVKLNAVPYSGVKFLRNESGKKYKACESCAEGRDLESEDIVFVATDGTKYHTVPGCKALSKSVRAVKLSETDLPPCKKCGKDVKTKENSN